MKNVQRNQQNSEAKHLMYPEQKKADKTFHKKNLDDLKSRQKENRDKKYEEENSAKPEPYKMKMFKNVESKLAKQMTINQAPSNNNISELKRDLQTTKPKEKRNPSVGFRTMTSDNHVKLPDIKKYDKNKNPEKNAYKKKEEAKVKDDYEDIKENKASAEDANIIQVFRHAPNSNLLKEEQVLMNIKKKMNKGSNNSVNVKPVPKDSKKEENIYAAQNVDEDEDMEKLMMEHEMLQQRLHELEDNNNAVDNKENKPVNCVKGMKEKKNYIMENKNKVNEIQPKQQAKAQEPSTHKNFGKVPEYLQKYKTESEEKKEQEKRLAEEKKYPKGTRLISEEERIQTLTQLQETRKELVNMLEKFPITMKTMSIQKKKEELEKKLGDIEEAIKTFMRKQVFIKDDTV